MSLDRTFHRAARVRHGKLLAGAALVVTLGLGAPVAAENLIEDPGFDAGAPNWFPNTGSVEVTWRDDVDVLGDPLSGSARVQSADSRTNVRLGMVQCVGVTPGEAFALEASTFFQSGQTETGSSILVRLLWNSGSVCANRIGGNINTNAAPDVPDTWHLLEASGTVPEGAESVEILPSFVFAAKNQPDGAFELFFDDVSFTVPEPSHAALSLAGLATLGMLAALRTRRRRLRGSSRAGWQVATTVTRRYRARP